MHEHPDALSRCFIILRISACFTSQIDSRRAALKAVQQADFISNALINELQLNVFVMPHQQILIAT
jgi:hypothetical protein